MDMTKAKSGRGFASMDPMLQRQIASKGGQASGGNFKYDREKARRAGRKGGKASHAKGEFPIVLPIIG